MANAVRFFSPGRGSPGLSRTALVLALWSALLVAVAAPVRARAGVIIRVMDVYGSVWAATNNRFGLPSVWPTDSDYDMGPGDFSSQLYAYHQEKGLASISTDPVAKAEAQLDYTAHASAQRFSATVDSFNFVEKVDFGASARSGATFGYRAFFELTDSMSFHALSSYGGGGRNSFGHTFELKNLSTGPVFDPNGDPTEPVDLVGVLQPGLYTLTYGVNISIGTEQSDGITLDAPPASFALTLDPVGTNPPRVPDSGSTVALLASSLAVMIATARFGPRLHRSR